MLHLQCTKKVLKIVGETKGGSVPLKPTLLSWHVNEFRVDRRKLLLFTNDLTYYSVFWYPATKPHMLNMKNVLASQLMESLMDIGLDVNIAEKYFTGFDHAIFTPTSSRRVLGVMNDQKQQLLLRNKILLLVEVIYVFMWMELMIITKFQQQMKGFASQVQVMSVSELLIQLEHKN